MKAVLRNIISIILFAISMPLMASVEAKCIEVHLNDGSIVTYVSDDVKSISHTETTMEVKYRLKTDTYQIDEVKKVAFNVSKLFDEQDYYYIDVSQDKYVVSNDAQYISIFTKTNNGSFVETSVNGDWMCHVSGWGDGLNGEGQSDIYIEENTSMEPRIGFIEFRNREFGISTVVEVEQRNIFIKPDNEHLYLGIEEQTISYPVKSNVDYNVECNSDWIDLVKLEEGLYELHVSANKLKESRYATIEFKATEYDLLKKVILRQLGFDDALLLEKHRLALIDLYNATNGDNWKNNTNWLSDKPLHLWHGVNNDIIRSPYVAKLELWDNNLVGEIPESFATLMDTIQSVRLDGNGLYGKIPDKVRQHPRWSEFGWNIIQQSPWFSNGRHLDMADINLRITPERDMQVEYLMGGSISALELFAKNKISHVMIDNPSDAQANMHLSYHNKGYATIISHADWGGESREATIERTKDYPITDYVRLWDSGDFPGISRILDGLGILGSSYLIDSEGGLIDFFMRDWSVPESYYNEMIDSILYARLGEPEDHPIFSTELYRSTDYSRDGEVVTLQTATVGNGIDIVFMGDAYVDRDMDTDGKYETDMKKSMEYFFSIEPYNSLRDRFNVYAVKVISPNEYYKDDGSREMRINFSNDICFEYASRIEGINIDKATIVNVMNNPNDFFISGYTNMYESGASVAHIDVGGPSEVIIHEAGGHGLAKLGDEYIYGGCEGNTVSDEDKETFKYYENIGWHENLDVTNSPEDVKWAHFLTDDRYKNEVGIYEGAWLWGYGIYRPTENSVMNQDYSWFNAPSRETIYKTVMKWSEGDTWEYNFEDFAEFDANNRNNAASRANEAKTRDGRKREIRHKSPNHIKGGW